MFHSSLKLHIKQFKFKAENAEKMALNTEESRNALQDIQIKEKNLKEQQEKYVKIINKQNYEDKYQKPTFLKNHQDDNPESLYIQVLGCRGAGKSTFINRFFRATGLRKNL